jgi:hypothetical protein
MKTKYVIIALALSLLAGGTLNAQTNTNSANVTAWLALKESQGTNFNPAAAEAVAIKDSILAQEQIPWPEVFIARHVVTAVGGREAWMDAARTNAGKSFALMAMTKVWDKDPTGWTQEMIEQGNDWAMSVARLPAASPEFRQQVWEVAKNKAGGNGSYNHFFKLYRATLPAAEQLAVTAQQKALLIAVPTRTEAQNAWLAEISADLIALSLDQQQ